ncbi:ER membrane glycoprotein subunit of the GPI transamidase complex-like protein [Tilletia horrida]|nr:ER membrane glycoprotein subunit of the GPI transamidase complex-like protein [Tilletia horrida]
MSGRVVAAAATAGIRCDAPSASPSVPALARKVLVLAATHRLLALLALLFVLPSIHFGPSFDSSSLLLTAGPPRSLGLHGLLEPLIRWDAVHFLEIAHQGYSLEHLFAFQPALPVVLRWSGSIRQGDQGWNASQAVLLASLAAAVAATLSPWLLFHITWRHTASPSLAFLSALLSIFSPAPATLVTPSPEAFFSVLTLIGLLALSPSSTGDGGRRSPRSALAYAARIAIASLAFAAATSFRANGVMLAGYVAFSLWWASDARVIPALVRILLNALIALPILPYIAFQWWAKTLFCQVSGEEDRPWCADFLPSIYTFVQRQYWNVGFLRYWEAAQLPNFVLAAPILALASYGTWHYTRSSSSQILSALFFLSNHKSTKKEAEKKVSESATRPSFHFTAAPTVLPHIVHNALTLALLLFVSHVQIALRFASPGAMPVVWWGAAAWVLQGRSQSGGARLQVVVAALLMWNVLSLCLYSGFYPPA